MVELVDYNISQSPLGEVRSAPGRRNPYRYRTFKRTNGSTQDLS